MPKTSPTERIAVVTVTLTLLTGCAGAQTGSPAQPAGARGTPAPALPSPLMLDLAGGSLNRADFVAGGRNDNRLGRDPWNRTSPLVHSFTVFYDVQRISHGRPHNHLRVRTEAIRESWDR